MIKIIRNNFYLILLLNVFLVSQNSLSQGINITGLEKTWEINNQALEIKNYRKTLKTLEAYKIDGIRLPMDIDYFLNKTDRREKRKFRRLLRTVIKNKKEKTPLILAYFNHNLNHQNYKMEAKFIAKNWVNLMKVVGQKKIINNNIYIEIVNEPVIYPHEWKQTAGIIIEHIRSYYPNTPIIVGASNYNSIFELSRLKPFPYKNLIYSFHFYEPFIFTHQGTKWTGDQNSTLGIPFPYYKDSINVLPTLSKKAVGTPGEINYRDYRYTGNFKAIEDKINIIAEWKKDYDVEVWCTEFGVTKNADTESRRNYLEKVKQTLHFHDIPGYIWEYEGNFGIKDLNVFKTKP